MPKEIVLGKLIQICRTCEHGNAGGCNGRCECTIGGRDILEYAKAGVCPKGKFEGVTADLPVPAVENARHWSVMPPEEIALGEAHAAICEGCGDQCKGVTRTREWAGKRWPVYVTSCKLGGCAGISLTVKGWCPAGKW